MLAGLAAGQARGPDDERLPPQRHPRHRHRVHPQRVPCGDCRGVTGTSKKGGATPPPLLHPLGGGRPTPLPLSPSPKGPLLLLGIVLREIWG